MNATATISRRGLIALGGAALAFAAGRHGIGLAADKQPNVSDADWPWWRGPRSNGHAIGDLPVLEWSETKNVVWKTPIAGRGHATPCIVGPQIFLATADEEQQTQSLVACDRGTGRVLWQKQLHAGGFGEKHEKNSHASATPACDGTRVFTVFLRDAAVWATAVNLKGEIVWQKKVGAYDDRYGYGSSPTIFEDSLIVAGDSPAAGFLVALDCNTGDERWRTERPAMTSYGAAVVGTINDRQQLILQGNRVAGYDPRTGRELWRHKAPAKATACSLCFDEERVYASGGYPERRLYGIRPDGEGELAAENLIWSFEQKSAVAYVPSPLLAGERLFVISDGGLASCLDTRDGRALWTERLGGDFSASTTLIGQHLFAASEQGRTFVLGAADEFQVIADNKLDEGMYASPVVCGGRLYLRTTGHLYCIGS